MILSVKSSLLKAKICNFYKKKITKKMYDNLREEYKNIFQILKVCQIFSRNKI